jgi:hypothetical protein
MARRRTPSAATSTRTLRRLRRVRAVGLVASHRPRGADAGGPAVTVGRPYPLIWPNNPRGWDLMVKHRIKAASHANPGTRALDAETAP